MIRRHWPALLFGGALGIIATLGGLAVAQPTYPPQLVPNGDKQAPTVRGSSPIIGLWFGPKGVGQAGHVGTFQAAGTPALSACGTGALATGATDRAGQAVATGATGCKLTFGVAYTNAPFCVVTDLTGTRASMSTTITAADLTIAGMTSGDTFAWNCIGDAGA